MTAAPVLDGAAADLLAVGERASGKRSFLLVSKVLGKHIPVPAAVCRLAGTALALKVADDPRADAASEALYAAVAPTPADDDSPLAAASSPSAALLAGADSALTAAPLAAADSALAAAPLAGADSALAAADSALAGADSALAAAVRLLDDVAASPPAALRDSTVVGFAETATGLAHQVAEALDCAWLQNTTRHPDAAGQIAFDESHSHATDQWLRWLPDSTGPLVIVDDELSTGATAAKLIALLHAREPRPRYVIACLVDARRAPGPLEALADELDTPIDVVSLGRIGDVELPAAGWSAGRLPTPGAATHAPNVRDVTAEWPCAPERHGLDRAGRAAFRAFAAELAEPLPPGSLVLGCGEHLALPQLAALASGPATLVSSTTRSPALVCAAPGYPLADGLAFPHPEAPGVPGFAYNVHPATRPQIVIHFSEPAHRHAADGLLRALAGAGAVTAVTLR